MLSSPSPYAVVAARARRPRAGAALHPAVRHRGRRGHSSYRVEMEASSPSSKLTAKHSAWWMIAPHVYGRSRTFLPFTFMYVLKTQATTVNLYTYYVSTFAVRQ